MILGPETKELPKWCSGKQSCLPLQEVGIPSLSEEEEMATHPSILAWRIPSTEEPGRLQSVHGVEKSQTRLSQLGTHSRIWLISDQGKCCGVALINTHWDFPVCLVVKNPPSHAGDLGLILG